MYRIIFEKKYTTTTTTRGADSIAGTTNITPKYYYHTYVSFHILHVSIIDRISSRRILRAEAYVGLRQVLVEIIDDQELLIVVFPLLVLVLFRMPSGEDSRQKTVTWQCRQPRPS